MNFKNGKKGALGHLKGQGLEHPTGKWQPPKCFPRFCGKVLKSVTKIPDLQL